MAGGESTTQEIARVAVTASESSSSKSNERSMMSPSTSSGNAGKKHEKSSNSNGGGMPAVAVASLAAAGAGALYYGYKKFFGGKTTTTPIPKYMPWVDHLPMSDTYDILEKIMKERIIVIDGAMGTSIQKYKSLKEEDFRGEQWKNHTHDLKGNNDLLVVTRPDVIGEIHGGMLEGGADIIETNTFNGTTISQADYELQDLKHVNLINTEGAKLAKRVCAEWTAKTPNKPRFVAGAIGPTNRTLSVSPSVENPAYRNCTYDEVVRRT
ncbi:methionine synthase [Pseudoscourfieldia marina]